MDTIRDRNALNEVSDRDPPPWLDFANVAKDAQSARQAVI